MPDSTSARSNASLACWKASSGFCTQIADSSTNCETPAARAAASACTCARWSMAQASAGAPVRDARHDTRRRSARRESRRARSEAGVARRRRSAAWRRPAPRASSAPAGRRRRPRRTRQTTSCPRPHQRARPWRGRSCRWHRARARACAWVGGRWRAVAPGAWGRRYLPMQKRLKISPSRSSALNWPGDLAQRAVRQAQFLGQQVERRRRACGQRLAPPAGARAHGAAPARGARGR